MIYLHQVAATQDALYVRQHEGFHLVHKNTGKVMASETDLIKFSNVLRNKHGLGMSRVTTLVRNRLQGEFA